MYFLYYILSLDTIFKAFQYGWFILVPLFVIIIVVAIRRKTIPHYGIVLGVLVALYAGIILTSRIWGPALYMYVVGNSNENKEFEIELQLEDKYDRNFTFLSKGNMSLDDPYSGSSIGQDIRGDYSVLHKYVDDDGVCAIVKYNSLGIWDYYEIKRAEYDLEQYIYDYVKSKGLKNEFYVRSYTDFEEIAYSSIESNPWSESFNNSRKYDDVILLLNEENESIKDFVIESIREYFKTSNYISLYEYVLTENSYQKAKNYYDSDDIRKEINDNQEKYMNDFDENDVISYRYYSAH